MRLIRLAGSGLLVTGFLALGYGGFLYTDSQQQARNGDLGFVPQPGAVDVPVWSGLVAMVAGATLLLVPRSRTFV